jgi:septum formation protein
MQMSVFELPYKIVLGSNSPRRRQLLADMGFEFEVRIAHSEELYPDSLPKAQVAAFLAKMKAEAIVLAEGELCITADTTVVLDNALLEKPATAEEAEQMIQKLSGRSHEVITGVCLRTLHQQMVFSDTTQVIFRTLSPEEISYYVRKFAPLDKAGAYGIQEWIGMVGISRIEGSYFNVVGLPTEKLYEALKQFSMA